MHQGINPGNVERVVTKAAASATYESTFFAYAKNGQTVTHVVGEQWNDDGLTSCFPLQTHGYVNTFGWEYRYDGARARYAARGLDPDRLYMVLNPLGGWSDYDGNEIYADFYVNASAPPTTTRRFEPGIGRTDYTGSTYYHADHLGTIRGVSIPSSPPQPPVWSEPMAFTAFGERIVGTQNSTSTRFGYVGSYGYESTPNFGTDPDSDIGFLHVGARYYDPATGRFLQRDPIGIRGGTNAYGYTGGHPTVSIDPTGLRNDWGLGDIPPDMLKEIRRREREREREENRRRNTTPQSPEDMKKELRNERIKQLVTGGLIGAGGLVSVPVGIVALCIDIGASVYAINDPG